MSIPGNDTPYSEDLDLIINQKNGRGAIFIGNLEAARSLSTLSKFNIKAVISVARGGFLTHSQQQLPNYLYLPALDNKNYDLSVHFDKTYDFIDRNRKKTNILVHCMAGISRSATIVIAYLMRKNGMTMAEAYSTVKRMRAIVRPNQGFVAQLERFQGTQKYRTTSVTKENRHERNRSLRENSLVDISQDEVKPTAMAIQSQDKIKPINLQQKINKLREKFGKHIRGMSFQDSPRQKPQTPRITGQQIFEPELQLCATERLKAKRTSYLRCKLSGQC